MLVPPNFWTSHLADGSIVVWCTVFGGVLGREEENEEDLEDEGVDEEGITENLSKGDEVI